MFGALLTTLTGKLSNRFLISAFLPCLVICSIFMALVVYSIGPDGILKTWNDQPAQAQAIIMIFYIALIYFIASLLTAFIGPVIRIYEGYWEGLPIDVKRWKDYRKGYYQREMEFYCNKIRDNNDHTYSLVNDENAIKNMGFRTYHDKLKKLGAHEKKCYRERYINFPPCDRKDLLMPTRFGNVMVSYESRPALRYGMSSTLLWPHLYVIISEKKGKLIELLTDARASLESLVFISILGALFMALGVPYAIFGAIIGIEHAGPIFLFTFWGGIAIWWLAYRGAIESARNYGDLMNTAFDLYHTELLKTLGLDEDLSLENERKLWGKVNALYYRGKDYGLKYKIPIQTTGSNEGKVTEPPVIKETIKGDKT